MDNRGSFFFFLLVFYFLLSSQSRPPLPDENRLRQRELDREQRAIRLLNESHYEDFNPIADRWLPILGLRKNDTYAWDLLPKVQSRVRDQLQSVLSGSGSTP